MKKLVEFDSEDVPDDGFALNDFWLFSCLGCDALLGILIDEFYKYDKYDAASDAATARGWTVSPLGQWTCPDCKQSA